MPSGSRLPAGQPTKSEWAGRGYPDELAPHPHPHPHPLDPGFGAGAVGYGNVVTGESGVGLQGSDLIIVIAKNKYFL